MGKIKPHEPVKLFCGILAADRKLCGRACDALCAHYGDTDTKSEMWLFTQTNYYRDEMGSQLFRQFISFESLIDPTQIVSAKHTTNDLEVSLSGGEKRAVNLDPGYLTLHTVTLATTKNYMHRIYLDRGIFLENTLRYTAKDGYIPWEWTYPDYRTGQYREYFNMLRTVYRAQLRHYTKN